MFNNKKKKMKRKTQPIDEEPPTKKQKTKERVSIKIISNDVQSLLTTVMKEVSNGRSKGIIYPRECRWSEKYNALDTPTGYLTYLKETCFSKGVIVDVTKNNTLVWSLSNSNSDMVKLAYDNFIQNLKMNVKLLYTQECLPSIENNQMVRIIDAESDNGSKIMSDMMSDWVYVIDGRLFIKQEVIKEFKKFEIVIGIVSYGICSNSEGDRDDNGQYVCECDDHYCKRLNNVIDMFIKHGTIELSCAI